MTVSRPFLQDFGRVQARSAAGRPVETRSDPGVAGERSIADPAIKTYLVAYCMDDDAEDGRDLSTLYAALQGLDSCARVFRSIWMVQTGLGTSELMQEISPLLGNNDKLLIVECGPTADWRGLRLDVSVWLQDLMAVNRSGPL